MDTPILWNLSTITYILVDSGFEVTPNNGFIRVTNNTHTKKIIDEIRAAIGDPINNTIIYTIDGVVQIYPD